MFRLFVFFLVGSVLLCLSFIEHFLAHLFYTHCHMLFIVFLPVSWGKTQIKLTWKWIIQVFSANISRFQKSKLIGWQPLIVNWKSKFFLKFLFFRPIIDNSSFSADNLRFSTNIPAYTDNLGLSLIIQVFWPII